MQISATQIAFVVLTLFTLGGGFGVVVTRNLIHAALFLIVSLFGVAGYFVLLEAPFLAAVQVLVYIGAIAVIMLFAVMMTRGIGNPASHRQRNSQWIAALIVAVALLATLGFTLMNQFGDAGSLDVQAATVEDLGFALVNPNAFVLPFEVASILLLGALIGSVVIARD